MRNLSQIESLKILLAGIEKSDDDIKLTIENETLNQFDILPSINNVGIDKENIEYIRNLILNRMALNNLEQLNLNIVGNNTIGYKIEATVRSH